MHELHAAQLTPNRHTKRKLTATRRSGDIQYEVDASCITSTGMPRFSRITSRRRRSRVSSRITPWLPLFHASNIFGSGPLVVVCAFCNNAALYSGDLLIYDFFVSVSVLRELKVLPERARTLARFA